MIINVIGCDGAGKTTVIHHCQQWLRSQYQISVDTIDKWMILDKVAYPESKFINCSDDELKNCISLMCNESRFLFLVYLYTTALMKYKESFNDKNRIIILDGYWYKHFASEKIIGNDEQWMKRVCSFLPKPDLTILFNVDAQVAYKRKKHITRCECGVNDICQKNFVNHQTKLNDEFKKLAVKNNWIELDANLDIEKVLKSTKDVLTNYIKTV